MNTNLPGCFLQKEPCEKLAIIWRQVEFRTGLFNKIGQLCRRVVRACLGYPLRGFSDIFSLWFDTHWLSPPSQLTTIASPGGLDCRRQVDTVSVRTFHDVGAETQGLKRLRTLEWIVNRCCVTFPNPSSSVSGMRGRSLVQNCKPHVSASPRQNGFPKSVNR